MAWTPVMIASQVVVLDQTIAFIARRQVPVLSELPLLDGLGLVWQTLAPGYAPSAGLSAAWITVSILVIVGLGRLIRRSGRRFPPLQAAAVGLILGGTASHLLDLLRWGEIVVTLHVQVNLFEAFTSVARLSQWLGLAALVAHIVRRRSALS
jgi:lipoprotein signal peptidase